MGNPSLSPLCQLTLEIWNWCLAHQITIHAEYLPGSKNTTADWESRHHQDSSNWHLCSAVFDTLNHAMGPFTTDLFASRMNHQFPVYCSWRPDLGDLAVDAFYGFGNPYLFPPFCLVGRALSKIQKETVACACLIEPAWPTQVWYQQLFSMLADLPVLLPDYNDLLLSPDHSLLPLQLEGSLHLTAWLVSGNSMKCKEFLRELQTSSSVPGMKTPTLPIMQLGRSGIAGVLNEVLIPFQHLW